MLYRSKCWAGMTRLKLWIIYKIIQFHMQLFTISIRLHWRCSNNSCVSITKQNLKWPEDEMQHMTSVIDTTLDPPVSTVLTCMMDVEDERFYPFVPSAVWCVHPKLHVQHYQYDCEPLTFSRLPFLGTFTWSWCSDPPVSSTVLLLILAFASAKRTSCLRCQ